MIHLFAGNKSIQLSEIPIADENHPKVQLVNFNKHPDLLDIYLDFEKSHYQTLNIFGKPKEELLAAFLKIFVIINAAGGIVTNPKNEILLIYRHLRWDLPKGKCEENETIEETALREVKEECGLEPLQITKKLTPTFHSYYLKGKRIMKKTHWFEMRYNDDKLPKPQLEEDITDIRWFNHSNIYQAMQNTYPSIKMLLEYYLNQK